MLYSQSGKFAVCGAEIQSSESYLNKDGISTQNDHPGPHLPTKIVCANSVQPEFQHFYRPLGNSVDDTVLM